MAQFSTLLPVFVLFTLCKPIVCSYGHFLYDRRDRAPYIDSREYSTQQQGQAAGTIRNRLRIPSTYIENNANYRPQEQQVEAPQVVGPVVHNPTNPATQRNYTDEITTVTAVENNVFSIFKTNFGPGLHLFDNVKRPDSDQMIGDQPDSSFEKHFHTPSSTKLSLTKGKVETSTPKHFRKKETGAAYIVDSKDCVEDDAKSGTPFCTRLRNYPEKAHLEEIIKTKFNNLEPFFGEDSLMPQDINQRFDNKSGEEFICNSRTRVIYPEAGLNMDYKWRFIVNTSNYKQGVRIEECINEGSVCGENIINQPKNYKVTCKQIYTYRWLVGYANGIIEKNQFQMPSCCKCVLTPS